ncbi:MAG TPA: winged helix-turn-helix domain-containing protein [Blastocatellia bacterium]|nr:winged helix-turn-helix domain-containing protein [Blastocatellia bacterium]
MSLLIDHLYRFGDFTLNSDQRTLLRKGRPRPLAPKVFDTLLILVEKNGRLVGKDELMSRLWPDTFVEDANLTFNIQQLRKALGDKARKPVYIETVTRRGYRFIAPVEEVLSEGTGSRISDQFEIADPQSIKPGNEPESAPDGQDFGVVAKKANEKQQTAAQQSLSAVPGSDTGSTSSKHRSMLLTAAILTILGGIVLVSWRFSDLYPADRRAEIKTVFAVPPRIEKLTATGQSRHAAISPDGKYVAYTRSFEKKASVWLRQLATNNNVEIVPGGGAIFGLAFANSGEFLYFARRGEAISEPLLYHTALYRVSLVGGVPTKIVDTLEGNFSISPDDKQIAFIRQSLNRDGEREYALMVVNSDGTGLRTLFVGTHPDHLDLPVWSPSDQSIICSYGSSDGGGQKVRLIQVKLADGTMKELTSDKFFHISRVAWLPDKSALIMTARKALGYNNQLWRVSYPSMESRQVTDDLSDYLDLSVASSTDSAVASQTTRVSDIWVGSSSEPQRLKKITQGINDFCWAPNGRLVYSSTLTGNIDLWIMQPDGSEQRQLTVKSGVNLRPAVPPDNRYIVFMSNRTGSFQAWRMNLDGTNQIQLTDGAAKDYSSISPDGDWVFYNTADDWHLWRVSIDGGEPVQLTPYIAARPAVSPDGKMVACVGRNESSRKLLILSSESGQLLKEFRFFGWGSRLQWRQDGKALFYCSQQNGVDTIMEQSLDGGLLQQIVDLDEDELFDFGYSADSQSFAVIRGGWHHDVVLISDFNRSWNTVNYSQVSPVPRS